MKRSNRYNMSSNEISETLSVPMSVVQRVLLACGVVGPVLFNVVYTIEGITRPGYNSLIVPISSLENGQFGWMQSANFIVFGLLIGCFAIGLRQTLTKVKGISAVLMPLFEGFVALGLIGDGIFTQDPLHTSFDVFTFTSALIVTLLFARYVARDTRWRGWTIYSIATAILSIVFLAAFGIAMSHGGPAGLFERLATLVRSIWTVLLCLQLLAGRSLSPRNEA